MVELVNTRCQLEYQVLELVERLNTRRVPLTHGFGSVSALDGY